MGTILKTELLKNITEREKIRCGRWMELIFRLKTENLSQLWELPAVEIDTSAYAWRAGPSDFRKGICGWQRYFSLKDDALCVFRRRKIGFVFQSYNLVPV